MAPGLDPRRDRRPPDADADRLHAGLNAPAVVAAVEQAVRRVVRRTPALRPLSVTVTK